jgi:hypothetical protein
LSAAGRAQRVPHGPEDLYAAILQQPPRIAEDRELDREDLFDRAVPRGELLVVGEAESDVLQVRTLHGLTDAARQRARAMPPRWVRSFALARR